jgi:L-fucose isomerase-like protein
MRAPKALTIPFKFREGYPDHLVVPMIESAVRLIKNTNIDITLTDTVVYDQDADMVAKKYNVADYDICILLVPTWFEPVTLVRAAKNFFGLPVVIWGFSNFVHNGERVNLGSSAGAGVAKGTLRELGVFHEYIYYSPDIGKDVQIKKQLWKIANVGRAVSLLNESRMISVGYQFGGMTIGDMDLTKMRSVFGPDLIELDSYTLISQMSALDVKSEGFKNAMMEVQSLLANPLGEKLERVTRMYLILKNFVNQYNAQAITLKCHFALSQEFGLTACIPLSVIGNQVVASCEADIPLVLTQLILHYLSSGELTTYADTHELTGKRVLWGACGFAPAGMCVNGKIICDIPAGQSGGLGDTFGDYITNKNHLKAGRMTVARILKEENGGFSLHAALGTALGDIGKTSEFGAPQYSFTEMELDAHFDRFAQNLGSHHYALVYADLAEELELFCRYKKINTIIESTQKND